MYRILAALSIGILAVLAVQGSSRAQGAVSSEAKVQAAQFEVLSPWADADPVPFRGVSPRVGTLEGATIGLLGNSKRTSKPTLDIVEDRLKKRFPSAKFSRFVNDIANQTITETPKKDGYEAWVKGVDTVVASYGD